MNKKEQLIDVFKQASECEIEYIAVAIQTRGSEGTEIIINPSVNREAKLEYYKKAYDDNLVLKAFDRIQILSACAFDKSCTMEEIEELLSEKMEDEINE